MLRHLRWCWLALLTGCLPEQPLTPSLALADTATLLPAETTLLLGGDLLAAIEAPTVSRAITARSGPRPALEARLEAMTGLRAGARIAESAVGGCTGDGCVLIVDGEHDGLSLDRMAQRLSSSEQQDGAVAIGRTHSTPVLVRPAGDHRTLLGHAAALESLEDGPRLDLRDFDGAIPEGDLWIAARDQDRLAEQMQTWLSAQSAPAAAESLAALEDHRARQPDWTRGVEVIALSISTTTAPMQATLRLTCEDDHSARLVQAALQAALAVGQQDDPVVEQALSTVTVYRWNTQVEARFVDTEGLAEQVVAAMEAQP